MNLSEFTNIFSQKPENFVWFLGAGASHSAGLPTANDIIWKLKLKFYCQNENQDIDRLDIHHAAVKDRIQSYVESMGFPSEWAPEEYSLCFEKVFGENKEIQRKFMADVLKEDDIRLSVGNRIFGALLQCKYCRIAFTTNFDEVVEKAYAEVSGKSLFTYNLEGGNSPVKALDNEEFPFYCKCHGDFRHESLKNLTSDLVEQNNNIAKCMINVGSRYGFIVAGYSGRDESVMSTFNKVLETPNPFPHGLFWTGMKNATISPKVQELLDKAKEKEIVAEYVEIETFDTLMLRLWRNIKGKPEEINNKIHKFGVSSTNIALPEPGKFDPLIRLNALPIKDWTKECLKLSFTKPMEWSDLKEAQRNSDGKLIFTKAEEIWCWGEKSEIKNVFGAEITSIESVDVSNKFAFLSKNLPFKSFLLEAICLALVRGKPLSTRSDKYYSHIIIDSKSGDLSQLEILNNTVKTLHGVVPGLLTSVTDKYPKQVKVKWAESVRVSIEQKDNQIWILLKPDIWIWPRRERKKATDFLDQKKKDRYNQKYNNLLSGWVQAIFGTSMKKVNVNISTFANGSGSENPMFTIGPRTGYSKRIQA